MLQPADQALVLRARSLLSDQEVQQQRSDLQAELISAGLACHSRMLELSESDRPAAVELAITGADLLRTVELLQASRSKIPDWVRIHEEQCCRYGAIWIHALVAQDHPNGRKHSRRGIALLQRLSQLHNDPITWVDQLKRDLEECNSLATQAFCSNELRVVVAGKSQILALTNGLTQALPNAFIYSSPPIEIATTKDVARLHQRLANADLLFMHLIKHGYREDVDIASDTLSGLLPPGAHTIVIPDLHYEGHHPWIGNAQNSDGRSIVSDDESPLGPYHDFLAMVAARDGIRPENLLNMACTPAQLQLLRLQHENSLKKLERHETDCDIALSDWLRSNHHRTPVFHTINKPTGAALEELQRRLLKILNSPQAASKRESDHHEYLGELTIPIHPWVCEALDLGAWASDWGQRQGKRFTIADQLQQSINFYQKKPWIIEANAMHPKLILAESLLENMQWVDPLIPKRRIKPDKPLSLFDCLWVSNSPLEALIDLGRWAMDQPAGDFSQLQHLSEAASRTRNPTLISAALERLNVQPGPEPWSSHMLLQLKRAAKENDEALRCAAQRALQLHHTSSQPWNEDTWRPITTALINEADTDIKSKINTILASEAPLEWAMHHSHNNEIEFIFSSNTAIATEDAHRAARLYAQCVPSIRKPFFHWADPEAVTHAVLGALTARIRQAKNNGKGFSLVRLGDGEGLFLCGRRPDIGGAIINGSQIEARLAAQGNQLEDPEHWGLRLRLAEAIANADWIGIPDPQQCLTGPVDCVSVASGLSMMLSPEQQKRAANNLVSGGWHIHNFLLQAGFYSGDPFDDVQAVIAPSLPLNLRSRSDLRWIPIPGENRLRADAFGDQAHYPRVFERTLDQIQNQITAGDLVLVGAGILGKIYCDAIRQSGGVGIDVGSVIDLCSGHGGTRGEYRMHPWLVHHAKQAFRPG